MTPRTLRSLVHRDDRAGVTFGSVAENSGAVSSTERCGSPGSPIIAAAMPALSPTMLLPRRRPIERPFPFDHAGVSYHYFARNGIYDLARHWGLEGQEVLFPAYFHGVELDALLTAGVRPSFFPVHSRMQVDHHDIGHACYLSDPLPRLPRSGLRARRGLSGTQHSVDRRLRARLAVSPW